MKPFATLRVWHDPVARPGPVCMAVDELLLREVQSEPLLRFYDWEGAWASVGYFGNPEVAETHFGGAVSLVRRWTGGGVVDHRQDLTYSLMIPRGHAVAQLRGAGSYAALHAAVAEALRALGVAAHLTSLDGEGESSRCFEKPVAWDVVDEAGDKLAGAGQRRTRWGLLHQGSVQLSQEAGARFERELKNALGEECVPWAPDESLLRDAGSLAREKYLVK